MNSDPRFAARLKAWRERRGLSQLALAGRARVPCCDWGRSKADTGAAIIIFSAITRLRSPVSACSCGCASIWGFQNHRLKNVADNYMRLCSCETRRINPSIHEDPKQRSWVSGAFRLHHDLRGRNFPLHHNQLPGHNRWSLLSRAMRGPEPVSQFGTGPNGPSLASALTAAAGPPRSKRRR